ncbi:MAG: potassium channel protein [Planctomycetota bacterium]|jgi:voltage-gated potassium channel|nr:potassium channel protein [Planctomycetota bacterium]
MPRDIHRFLIFLLLIVLILGMGTAGYSWIEDWPLAESLYMTVITVTTVGYGEIPAPLSPNGRHFTMFLIFSGILTISVGVSVLTSVLVESRFELFVHHRRKEKIIMKLTDHYILCGAGRAGRAVIEELLELNVPLVVIDNHHETLNTLEHDYPGINILSGDATHDEILIQAGIERAHGLVSNLSSDAENLYVCLAAREKNPNLRIVTRAENEENITRMKKAGANNVISPTHTGARRMVAMLFHPQLTSFLDAMTRIGDTQLMLEEFTIYENSSISGLTLAEAKIPQKTGLIVIAIRNQQDSDFIFNPSGATRLTADNEIVVLGEADQITRLGDLIGAGVSLEDQHRQWL